MCIASLSQSVAVSSQSGIKEGSGTTTQSVVPRRIRFMRYYEWVGNAIAHSKWPTTPKPDAGTDCDETEKAVLKNVIGV
jgi:hypothetical protein